MVRWKDKLRWIVPALMLLAVMASPALAEEPAMQTASPTGQAIAEQIAALSQTATTALFTANNLWMMVCAALVFLMHLGFATLESGLTRAKNTVNILCKNTLIPAIGLLTYAIIGFNLMYPGEDYAGKFFGFGGFGLPLPDNGLTPEYADGGYTYWTDFLFQGMFAATAATIVSGAVAERIKLSSFLVFSTIFVAISYPITGMWQWGGGWLSTLALGGVDAETGDPLGFYDFAGSTLVHAVGGWGALTGSIILGARLGKYSKDGGTNPIPGHNMPLATIGVFLLWLGWFGFNGGSVLSADPGAVSLTLVTTSLAASAGAIGAALASWVLSGKPDLSMVLNGVLAGLVGITAGADQMGPGSSMLIGIIAGVLVVLSVFFFDKIKIDDPVGAISVHLVCGIWGTLAVGIFGAKAGMGQLLNQFVGVISIGAFTVIFTTILWLLLKFTLGIRVTPEEEFEGLDLGEHDMAAYPDFQPTYIKSYHIREA